jgi:glycosyltransferase involved in cell wall biosynthesis
MSDGYALVSIGMPVRNCQATLHLALESLLVQTYSNWELLLINDGSLDETLQVAAQFSDPRIKIYSDGESRGLTVRLNQAISMSRGSYFARMDGDDIAYPERLERQVGYLERHPEVDLVGAWVMVFNSAGAPLGKRIGPETHDAICARPWAGFPMAHPTYVGQLGWFRRYRYNKIASKSQDQELLLRSYRFSQFANVPMILLGYREGRIDLKKILTGRWFLAQALVGEFRRQQQPGLAARALVEQVLKAIVDCMAVGSGLNYRLLRHRARPITDAERWTWERVWQHVSLTAGGRTPYEDSSCGEDL